MACLKHAINNWPCAFTSEIFTKHKAVKAALGIGALTDASHGTPQPYNRV